jgi:hypothetical protein
MAAALTEDEMFYDILFDDDDDDSTIGAVAAVLHVMATEDDSEEDEDDENIRPPWGGSAPGRRPNKNRDFAGADLLIRQHYFSGDASTYDEKDFERRFVLSRVLFCRIFEALKDLPDFRQKKDALGRKGITPLCRVTACLRVLAYGDPSDRIDEYVQMSESAIAQSLKKFTSKVIELFGPVYLNQCPTDDQKERACNFMDLSGFRGAFGSWDCKHFIWKRCPIRLAGLHKGAKSKSKTLILEAICDRECYMWYVFFGEPGSLNDINILDKSSIVGSIINGNFNTKIPIYKLGETIRDWMYFLADGIYPPWSIFVKTNAAPLSQDELKYAKRHEHVRKDIERAFGQLVMKFRILDRSLRFWHLEEIRKVLDCCVILHNMGVEERRVNFSFSDLMDIPADEEDMEIEDTAHSLFGVEGTIIPPSGDVDGTPFTSMAQRVTTVDANMRNAGLHFALQSDVQDFVIAKYSK